MKHVPVPTPAVVRAALVLTVAAAVGLLLWLAVSVAQLSTDLRRADARLDAAHVRSEANRAAAEALARQVRRLGGKPVVAPSVPVPGPQGVQGIQGIPGPPGPVGRPPTLNEVIAALAAYCGDGDCRGPAGRDGRDGEDGGPGPQGEPGESVTGPPGPPGPPGPAGSDGRDGRDGTPGPTCPDGYTAQERTIRTDQAPQGETAVVCVRD